MKVFQKSLQVRTKKANDFINITSGVASAVKESKIKDGMCFVNCVHTTAAVIVQENDARIHRDLTKRLDEIIPLSAKYEHMDEGVQNAVAHIKSNLLGSSLALPVKDGELVLGTWQELFFVELFEARNRKIIVTVIGE